MSIAPLLALHETLEEAEHFVAGFENDPHQDTEVERLLVKLRSHIGITQLMLDVTRAHASIETTDLALPTARLRGAA
jgi:hypothetical protein